MKPGMKMFMSFDRRKPSIENIRALDLPAIKIMTD